MALLYFSSFWYCVYSLSRFQIFWLIILEPLHLLYILEFHFSLSNGLFFAFCCWYICEQSGHTYHCDNSIFNIVMKHLFKKSKITALLSVWVLLLTRQFFKIYLNYNLIVAHKGGRDSWALTNHVLPQCCRSYGLWLNKANHLVK